jgi:hypothetical protein
MEEENFEFHVWKSEEDLFFTDELEEDLFFTDELEEGKVKCTCYGLADAYDCDKNCVNPIW